MALPLYALTLFVSAFILFLVQPIVGKIILPKLGGTPQVWNTCMVFFQMVLLAGYAYTHNATSRMTLRGQLIAHGVLLLLPLIILLPFPFALGGEYREAHTGSITAISTASDAPVEITSPNNGLKSGMRVTISGVEGKAAVNGTWMITVVNNDKFTLDGSRGSGSGTGGTYVGGIPNPNSLWGFVPDLGSNPIPSTLAILFLYVALPFLVVATSAPLLQKWFVHTGHPAAKDPYFLYGASNLGSMLSLIIYPILVEPYTRLKDQGWVYTGGYVFLIICVMTCAGLVWHSREAAAKPKPTTEPPPPPTPEPMPGAAHTTAGTPQTGVAAGAPATPAAPPTQTAVKTGAPPAKGQAGKGPIKPHGAEPSIKLPASDEMTLGRRLRWVLLAAIPSSLMLGITTHITTDLSPQPMFWLVPLILYLASFIFVFARWPVVWTEGPHRFFVIAQPFCIALMIMVDVLHLTSDTRFLVFAMFAHVLGFFTTTMVCHGELAKDRPTTKHLTDFYLMMSVGGMLGGMFNALIAPIVFQWGIWEFPLCIFAAAIARPKVFESGLFDNLLGNVFGSQPDSAPTKPGQKGKHAVAAAPRGADESLANTLDFAWAGVILVTVLALGFVLDKRNADLTAKLIAYSVPLAMCCMCLARPIRFGLGIGAVLLVYMVIQAQNDSSTIHSSRSYFGAVNVKEFPPEATGAPATYRQLIHGHIDHGMNFVVPEKKFQGDPKKDLSRLATTYYHREGPAGRVMEKYNWFKGPPNTFWADARMPASLVGAGASDIFGAGLPAVALVDLWSEPPFATVGLGTGTMASYGRAYQHVHFYEIDNQILGFSLAVPTRKITTFKEYEKVRANARRETYFNYLERAVERGSTVQVLMGDARLRMALPYRNHYATELNNEPDDAGGPENFYHMMVVDAFSSDAIPAHLLTEEAFRMYFDHLTEKGILCVHTSNRFVELPKVVAAVSAKLNLAHRRGHDIGADEKTRRLTGHYSSEWVMVARKDEYLAHLTADPFLAEYDKNTKERAERRNSNEQYWQSVHVNDKYRWTDDYYNLLSVVRFRPRGDD